MNFQLNDDYEERAAMMDDPYSAMLEFKRGTVLFCGGECHIEEAKDYIKENGFTQDHVALVKRGDMIMVIMK